MESLYGTVAGLDVHKKTVVVVLLQSAQPDHDDSVFRRVEIKPDDGVQLLGERGIVAHLEGASSFLCKRPHSF